MNSILRGKNLCWVEIADTKDEKMAETKRRQAWLTKAREIVNEVLKKLLSLESSMELHQEILLKVCLEAVEPLPMSVRKGIAQLFAQRFCAIINHRC